MLAVELFEVRARTGGAAAYVVNELAMRPHNSGHWTMDGAVTGQFEQHLRAVLDLPLGDPRPARPWTVMANVLGGELPDELYPAYRHVMARDPGVKVHLYGKGVRPGRKIGHVNVVGADLADARERAGHAADYLRGDHRMSSTARRSSASSWAATATGRSWSRRRPRARGVRLAYEADVVSAHRMPTR